MAPFLTSSFTHEGESETAVKTKSLSTLENEVFLPGNLPLY